MPLSYRSADAVGVVWPNGSYQARCEKASEEVSGAGNPMIRLVWSVWAPDGQSRTVYDYITLNKARGIQKLGELAEAIGKGERFRADKLDVRDISGCIATVILGLKVSKDPKYGDDNEIKTFGELEKLIITPRAAAEREPGDDDDDDWPTRD